MGRVVQSRRSKVGAWIQYIRKNKGLSQAELARRVHVPRSTVSYWEKTGKVPGYELIPLLSAELNMDALEFFRLRQGKFPPVARPPQRRKKAN